MSNALLIALAVVSLIDFRIGLMILVGYLIVTYTGVL